MSLVNKVIPGLYNGVSQQPAGVRLDTQLEKQINSLPSLAEGNAKRPPSAHIANLSVSGVEADPFIHTINRDASEKYIVVFTGDATTPIDVFTIDGTACTVQYGHLDASLNFTADAAVKAYVTGSSPQDKFKAVTIADYTIVSNSTKIPAMTADVASGTLKGSKQAYTDLPVSGMLDGDVYRIAGDRTDMFTSYYVKWDNTDGVWEESMAPGISIAFDATTMPHRLVRTGTNIFTFADINWEERSVGDDDIAPIPSFLGGAINDVIMHKNRLVFLSGENCIMSRAGEFFDFWVKTCLDILDDAVIDVASSSEQVSILKNAKSFNESLILFSDQLQFALHSGDNNLTPGTVAIDITTRFECNNKCKPVGAGPNVYFAQPKGAYSAVREYYVSPDTLTNDAADITAHCPNYLPKNLIKLASSSALELILGVSSEEPSTLYCYRYYWQGDEKAQSSWGSWTFDGEIKNVDIIDNYAYIVVERGTALCLERITLESVVTGTLPFRVHLDRQCELTGVYDDVNNWTTWTLPYTADVEDTLVVVRSDTGTQVVNVTRPDTTSVRATGDHSAVSCYLGITYEMRVGLTAWSIKAPNTNVDVLQGRLQVRSVTVGFVKSGYFTIEAQSPMLGAMTSALEFTLNDEGESNVDAINSEWTGVVLGFSQIGRPYIGSGRFKALVLANARGTVVELVNDTYLPSTFQNASWEGFYSVKSRSL